MIKILKDLIRRNDSIVKNRGQWFNWFITFLSFLVGFSLTINIFRNILLPNNLSMNITLFLFSILYGCIIYFKFAYQLFGEEK